MRKRSSGLLHVVAVLVAGGFLLGCKTEDDGADKTQPGPDVSTTSALDPTPAPPTPIREGQPWPEVVNYLDRTLRFAPVAGHFHQVKMCDGCKRTGVLIRPEVRAGGVRGTDLASGQRVIARLDHAGLQSAPELGFTGSNRRSWLLAESQTSAVIMYRSPQNTVAFARGWQFEVQTNPIEMGKQKARWRDRPHRHGGIVPDTASLVHLQSAWVSCAEGCCNATFTQ